MNFPCRGREIFAYVPPPASLCPGFEMFRREGVAVPPSVRSRRLSRLALRRAIRSSGTQGLLADSRRPGIDIGRPSRVFPVTPPCVRVRTRRFKLVMSWVSIGDSVSPGPRRPRQAVPSTGLGCDSAAMDRVPYEPCRLPEGATLLETPVAGIGFGARPTGFQTMHRRRLRTQPSRSRSSHGLWQNPK